MRSKPKLRLRDSAESGLVSCSLRGGDGVRGGLLAQVHRPAARVSSIEAEGGRENSSAKGRTEKRLPDSGAASSSALAFSSSTWEQRREVPLLGPEISFTAGPCADADAVGASATRNLNAPGCTKSQTHTLHDTLRFQAQAPVPRGQAKPSQRRDEGVSGYGSDDAEKFSRALATLLQRGVAPENDAREAVSESSGRTRSSLGSCAAFDCCARGGCACETTSSGSEQLAFLGVIETSSLPSLATIPASVSLEDDGQLSLDESDCQSPLHYGASPRRSDPQGDHDGRMVVVRKDSVEATRDVSASVSADAAQALQSGNAVPAPDSGMSQATVAQSLTPTVIPSESSQILRFSLEIILSR